MLLGYSLLFFILSTQVGGTDVKHLSEKRLIRGSLLALKQRISATQTLEPTAGLSPVD
jgi:hypothetical protein